MTSDAGVYAYSAVLMGSPILLKLFDDNPTLARQVFQLIKQQENLFTVNRAESEVMSINHAAGRHPVRVSEAVFRLISVAHAVSVSPGSAFNFTIGPVVKRWKIGFQGRAVPPANEIAALLLLTDPHQVILNPEDRSVFLQQPGMEIDLGAIAKGYIADVVQSFLRQQGVPQALINLGGNVQTLGAPPHEPQGWSIGLKKPFGRDDELLGVLQVQGKSVVTSGIYERYFELDGKCWHHIFDPHTGYPLDNELLSVTVISDRSLDGDIYTTLLYGMGLEQGLDYLADQPDLDAVFVTRDRQIICSSPRHFQFHQRDFDWQLRY
ncbi:MULTISPECIES: FAD:protein FMN transferase [unclassified Pantoea]|uniref:FAD:protein FMN transferase n=1 Tax=unclassified Pantoea TaxID=2630326 RepID=UPI001CD2FDDE|nr:MULTISPECIES: FAD:protein FMN transferase [unclassified Pantoea]MCA1175249.1 FAD:protein FMN transferase [Pantoea sp. alder69]MCA1250211.1 FAD:protein FMN transferase [Pantoea sp. alder70]MCA1263834.1 FAD:protein FMN transferase [Pantoea sp. alder81]